MSQDFLMFIQTLSDCGIKRAFLKLSDLVRDEIGGIRKRTFKNGAKMKLESN